MTTSHTPAPWHYVSGAVWHDPMDADRPDACAIALRGSLPSHRRETFTPTEKDANMRRIVACVNACEGFDDPAASIAALRVAGGNGLDALLQADRMRAALQAMWECAGDMTEAFGMDGADTMTDEHHAKWQHAAGMASVALAEPRAVPIDDDTGAAMVMPHFIVIGGNAYWMEPFGLGGRCLMTAPLDAASHAVRWDDGCECDPAAPEYAAIVACLEATS